MGHVDGVVHRAKVARSSKRRAAPGPWYALLPLFVLLIPSRSHSQSIPGSAYHAFVENFSVKRVPFSRSESVAAAVLDGTQLWAADGRRVTGWNMKDLLQGESIQDVAVWDHVIFLATGKGGIHVLEYRPLSEFLEMGVWEGLINASLLTEFERNRQLERVDVMRENVRRGDNPHTFLYMGRMTIGPYEDGESQGPTGHGYNSVPITGIAVARDGSRVWAVTDGAVMAIEVAFHRLRDKPMADEVPPSNAIYHKLKAIYRIPGARNVSLSGERAFVFSEAGGRARVDILDISQNAEAAVFLGPYIRNRLVEPSVIGGRYAGDLLNGYVLYFSDGSSELVSLSRMEREAAQSKVTALAQIWGADMGAEILRGAFLVPLIQPFSKWFIRHAANDALSFPELDVPAGDIPPPRESDRLNQSVNDFWEWLDSRTQLARNRTEKAFEQGYISETEYQEVVRRTEDLEQAAALASSILASPVLSPAVASAGAVAVSTARVASLPEAAAMRVCTYVGNTLQKLPAVEKLLARTRVSFSGITEQPVVQRCYGFWNGLTGPQRTAALGSFMSTVFHIARNHGPTPMTPVVALNSFATGGVISKMVQLKAPWRWLMLTGISLTAAVGPVTMWLTGQHPGPYEVATFGLWGLVVAPNTGARLWLLNNGYGTVAVALSVIMTALNVKFVDEVIANPDAKAEVGQRLARLGATEPSRPSWSEAGLGVTYPGMEDALTEALRSVGRRLDRYEKRWNADASRVPSIISLGIEYIPSDILSIDQNPRTSAKSRRKPSTSTQLARSRARR